MERKRQLRSTTADQDLIRPAKELCVHGNDSGSHDDGACSHGSGHKSRVHRSAHHSHALRSRKSSRLARPPPIESHTPSDQPSTSAAGPLPHPPVDTLLSPHHKAPPTSSPDLLNLDPTTLPADANVTPDTVCVLDGGSPSLNSSPGVLDRGNPSLNSSPGMPSSGAEAMDIATLGGRREDSTPHPQTLSWNDELEVVNLITPDSHDSNEAVTTRPDPPNTEGASLAGVVVSEEGGTRTESTTLASTPEHHDPANSVRTSVIQHTGPPRRSRHHHHHHHRQRTSPRTVGDHHHHRHRISLGTVGDHHRHRTSPGTVGDHHHHRHRISLGTTSHGAGVLSSSDRLPTATYHPVLIVGHFEEASNPSPPRPSSSGESVSTLLASSQPTSSLPSHQHDHDHYHHRHSASSHVSDHSYSLVSQLADNAAPDDLHLTEHSYSLASIGALEAPPRHEPHPLRASVRRSNRLSSRLGPNGSGASGFQLGRGQSSSDAVTSSATELSRTQDSAGLSASVPIQLTPQGDSQPATSHIGGAEPRHHHHHHHRLQQSARNHTPFSISDLLVPNSSRRRRLYPASGAEGGDVVFAPTSVTFTPRISRRAPDFQLPVNDPLITRTSGGVVSSDNRASGPRSGGANLTPTSSQSESDPILLSPDNNTGATPTSQDSNNVLGHSSSSSAFTPTFPRLHLIGASAFPPPPLLFESGPPPPPPGTDHSEDPGSDSASEFLRELDRQAELLNQSLEFIDSRSRTRRSGRAPRPRRVPPPPPPYLSQAQMDRLSHIEQTQTLREEINNMLPPWFRASPGSVGGTGVGGSSTSTGPPELGGSSSGSSNSMGVLGSSGPEVGIGQMVEVEPDLQPDVLPEVLPDLGAMSSLLDGSRDRDRLATSYRQQQQRRRAAVQEARASGLLASTSSPTGSHQHATNNPMPGANRPPGISSGPSTSSTATGSSSGGGEGEQGQGSTPHVSYQMVLDSVFPPGDVIVVDSDTDEDEVIISQVLAPGQDPSTARPRPRARRQRRPREGHTNHRHMVLIPSGGGRGRFPPVTPTAPSVVPGPAPDMPDSVGDDDAFVASRHNITPNDAVRFIRLASGNHPTARVLWNPILALGSTFEDLLELAETLGPARPQGLSKEVINNLPLREIGEDTTDVNFTSKCVVCLCEFEAGDKVRTLPCVHEFHRSCIDQWLEGHKTCPICRVEIRTS